MWLVKRAVMGPTIVPRTSKIAKTPINLQKVPGSAELLGKTENINIPATKIIKTNESSDVPNCQN